MKTLPRLKFAHLPTPVEHLSRLATMLGGPRLLVKRDDQTGLAFGGNKTRKLEFLVAEAQAHGAGTLITAGALQSNHCRQTAAIAARLGFDCILVLSGDEPTSLTGNLFLDHLFGAEIVWTAERDSGRVLKMTFEKAWEDGLRPYLIPYGGSNATGAAGYAFAMQELLEQGYSPDWILMASSSGGTQAGLVAGARLFGYEGNILGISVDEPADILKERVAILASATTDLLDEPINFLPEEINVDDRYIGMGYGVLDASECEAIRLFALTEGMLLDPVYTGKAAAGLIDLIRKGFFHTGDTVMFWHTGGTPALFADQYELDLQRFNNPS
jgi:D-cysteine desulfhydrase family pyridoxal phosphate-dependent enzyme